MGVVKGVTYFTTPGRGRFEYSSLHFAWEGTINWKNDELWDLANKKYYKN